MPAIGSVLAVVGGIVLSTLGGIAQGLLQAAFTKRPKPPFRDSRQQQNVSSTVENIPVVYGRARVGGIRTYADVKQAFVSTDRVQVQGEWIEVDVRGDYLYQTTVFCEGEIDEIEEILIDGIPQTDERFGTLFRVDINLDWVYVEPDDPVSYNPLVGWSPIQTQAWRKLIPGSFTFAPDFNRDRYRLMRKNLDTGKEILVARFDKGTQSVELPNSDFGNFEFSLYYQLADGSEPLIGRAEVTIAPDDADFMQPVNDNLTVSQNAFQDGEYIRFETREGIDDQTAIQFMVDEAPEYTNTMRGQGLAYVGHRFLKYNGGGEKAKKSPIKSVPTVTAIVRGRKIYDPRDINQNANDPNTWTWSDNPALVLLDYLTNSRFGAGFSIDRMNIDSFIALANHCDEPVITPEGFVQKRYVFNGVIPTDQTITDNIQNEILTTFNGFTNVVNGKWIADAKRVIAPVLNIDEDWILGDVNLSQTGLRNKHNTIKGQWINPDNNWSVDIVETKDNSYVLEDTKELNQDIELFNVTNFDQAWRLSSAFLKQSRLPLRLSFKADVALWQATPGDVINITMARYGFVAKPFRILNMFWNQEQNDLFLNVSCEEYSSDVYNPSTTKVKLPAGTSNLTDFSDVRPPSNIKFDQVFDLTPEGTFIPRIRISWTPSQSNGIDRYQVEVKPKAFGNYEIIGNTQSNSIETNTLNIGLYDCRVKGINSLGFESEYTIADVEVTPRLEPPADVTGFELTQQGTSVLLTWNAVPEASAGGFYRVIVVKSILPDAVWEDQAEFEFFVSGDSTSLTLPATKGTYFIKARNAAGIESVNAASQILDLPPDSDFTVVQTAQFDPTFSGPKENMTVIDNNLVLTSLITFDEKTGLFDNAAGLFDNAGGSAQTGSYSPDTIVDLGNVYGVRISKEELVTVVTDGLNFDDTPGLFDDRTGTFDNQTSADYSARLLVSSTTDDPNGSPVWTDFTPVFQNDLTARGLRFRFDVNLTNIGSSITVEQLRGLISMRRRTEEGTETITSVAQTVNFANAFFIAPTAVIANIEGPLTGDTIEVTNITTTGFDVTTRDSGGSVVTRDISWIANAPGLRQ